MTDPGAPRRAGRHTGGEGPGGVPPFYWMSTDGGRGPDGRSDATGPLGAAADPARYPDAGYGRPRYEDARYAVPGYDDARGGPWEPVGLARATDGARVGSAPPGHRSPAGGGGEAGRDRFPVAGRSADPSTAGLPFLPSLTGRHSDPGNAGGRPRSPGSGPGDAFGEDLGFRSTSWSSDSPGASGGAPDEGPTPVPPPPPGVWERLHRRDDGDPDDLGADEQETAAHPLVQDRPAGRSGTDTGPLHPQDDPASGSRAPHPGGPARMADRPGGDGRVDDRDDGFVDDPDADPDEWEDRTGGLDVIGAHVEEDTPRRGRRRRRRAARAGDAEHGSTDDAPTRGMSAVAPEAADQAPGDEDIPVTEYEPRRGSRRRRRPLAVLVSLVVLAGLVVGIVVGGQALLGMINPSSEDYTGQGAGSVEIRIREGDTLSDIARTLVTADVIASTGPFVEAAEAEAAATGIQPGVYALREQMSGSAALDLLLDPASRQVTRVTVPEGRTVRATLAQLAETTGTPPADWEAAAANPAALGLPPYANGQLEGFLFPATYDVEPGTTPADLLGQMVQRSVQALDGLQIPAELRLTVLTKASIVQAEASSTEDMAMVARVLENRLADGMPLQLDTTVNYANGKGGITTTPEDRANPSPYNTYVHAGLPPGPISNPGEDALRAVLNPTPGDWRYFVVVDPDTGDTRFAVTGEEHQQNVLLFQQWLRDHPGE